MSFAGPEARRIHRAAFPCVPLDPDKNIRITFEEEVFECCERWRGHRDTACNPLYNFCPECGKKL